MDNRQESKQEEIKIISNRASKDLVIIAILLILVLVLSYFFNLFVFLIELFQRHPKAITYIDEILTALLTLSISFGVFSWRRWGELKKETAERIKLQEELIRIANTKAETERIISKQLHCEIEQRKQDEQRYLSH
jgi:hypothetical protein